MGGGSCTWRAKSMQKLVLVKKNIYKLSYYWKERNLRKFVILGYTKYIELNWIVKNMSMCMIFYPRALSSSRYVSRCPALDWTDNTTGPSTVFLHSSTTWSMSSGEVSKNPAQILIEWGLPEEKEVQVAVGDQPGVQRLPPAAGPGGERPTTVEEQGGGLWAALLNTE